MFVETRRHRLLRFRRASNRTQRSKPLPTRLYQTRNAGAVLVACAITTSARASLPIARPGLSYDTTTARSAPNSDRFFRVTLPAVSFVRLLAHHLYICACLSLVHSVRFLLRFLRRRRRRFPPPSSAFPSVRSFIRYFFRWLTGSFARSFVRRWLGLSVQCLLAFPPVWRAGLVGWSVACSPARPLASLVKLLAGSVRSVPSAWLPGRLSLLPLCVPSSSGLPVLSFSRLSSSPPCHFPAKYPQ